MAIARHPRARCARRRSPCAAAEHNRRSRQAVAQFMHTPPGFSPSHVLPPPLPAGTLAFAFREDENRGRRHREMPAIPSLGALDRAGITGTNHYLGELDGTGCVAVTLQDTSTTATRNPTRCASPACARSFQAARAAAGAGRACVPGRRVGPYPPILRTLRHADARQGWRALQGVPGVRARRVPAQFAGHDGAGHARPRAAAGARDRFPGAMYSALAGSSRRARRSRMHPREVREEVGIDVTGITICEPVVAVPHR